MSDPAPGSDIAIAVSASPEAIRGNQRCFCSGEQYERKYGAQMSTWTRTPLIASPSACASSANTALCRNVVSGLPPYSIGMPTPRMPAAPARDQKLQGGAPAFSHSAYSGTTSSVRKVRTCLR